MTFRTVTLCATLVLAQAGVASAQAVKLEFLNGRVNLVAQNAPVRTILAEWARLGGTKVVNSERLTGAPVTIELKDYPERAALDIVLRSVPGYMITARQLAGAGTSHFDRIMVLPVASQPRPAPNVATFSQPAPRPVFNEEPDDDVEDITALRRQDQEALRRAEELARQRALEQAQGGRVVGQPVIGGAAPFIPAAQQPPPPVPMPQAPAARPSSPFLPLPGSARPGEITPVPQQQDRQPNGPDREP
jgi:hypothetical protein